jgi:hypothetical protein
MAGVASFLFFLRGRCGPDVDEDVEVGLETEAIFAVMRDAWCFRFLPRIGTGVRCMGIYGSTVTRQQSRGVQHACAVLDRAW